MCFFKCVFVNFFSSVISFVCYQIHFGKFFFFSCTMVVFPMKEVWLVITMDDLDFEVKDVQ